MATFWNKLVNVQAGSNKLGDITLQGPTLQGEFDAITNQGRKILVEARPFIDGGGYQLLHTLSNGLNVEEVFWLPWLNYHIVSTQRAAYECGKCNFFMTTGLTGCRFTITPELVLHVAHSVGFNSAARTAVELEHTGPRHDLTRRLSITATHQPNDFHYEGPHRTLVFGMKLFNGVWTYKIYRTYPEPSWEIML